MLHHMLDESNAVAAWCRNLLCVVQQQQAPAGGSSCSRSSSSSTGHLTPVVPGQHPPAGQAYADLHVTSLSGVVLVP